MLGDSFMNVLTNFDMYVSDFSIRSFTKNGTGMRLPHLICYTCTYVQYTVMISSVKKSY